MSGRLPTYYDYKEQFDLPDNIITLAKTANNRVTSNHPKAIMCAASIIVACGQEGWPITVDDLCSISSIPPQRVERVSKEIQDELGW